ncbi:MAG: phospholipase D family protein [Verrucomicrobiota bacterium]
MFHYSFLLLIAVSLTSCATAPPNDSRASSYVFTYTDTSHSPLAQAAKRKIGQKGKAGESGARLLTGGQDAFLARMKLTEHAQKSIDLQYYIWNQDLTGRLFSNQLIKAADRGVRVRLLVDDMVLIDRDTNAAILDQHPNIEVRIFNPFSRKSSRVLQMLGQMKTITRRMHNKSFTVDGHVCILGGRNIGDEYFGANDEIDYGDLDTLVIGPVVKEMEHSFDTYWNNELSYPIATLHPQKPSEAQIKEGREKLSSLISTNEADRYRKALTRSHLAEDLEKGQLEFAWGQARIIGDAPEKISSSRSATNLHLTTALKPYFDKTQKELIIISPYFVPTKTGTTYLASIARRGVKVRILTNSLASTDVPAVHAGYRKYRKDLLAAGIELYEVNDQKKKLDSRDLNWLGGASKSSLHAKSFVFDRQQSFIGSFNFDPRSAKENTEVGIVLDSPEIAQELAFIFDNRLKKSVYQLQLSKGKLLWQEVKKGELKIHHKDPHTSFFQRLTPRLMGLLPIEWLL